MAGDVLLTFLYRYGSGEFSTDESAKAANDDPNYRTNLMEESVIVSKHGEADMTAVFKMEDCIEAFTIAFNRVRDRLEVGEDYMGSYLTDLISERTLLNSRLSSHREAQRLEDVLHKKSPRSNKGSFGNIRRAAASTPNQGRMKAVVKSTKKRGKFAMKKFRDATAKEIVAGYSG